ncbi:MAG: hypothetical protein ACK47B_06055 [Armatimonadota bacterium]
MGPNENRKIRTEEQPRPEPEWVRGTCPRCGEELVSNAYYVSGNGYLVLWECWGSLGAEPTCDYRHVL